MALGAATAACPGGTITNGCVYAVGGYNTGFLSTNEAYRTWDNTWVTENSMPTARDELAVVAARCPFGSSATCIYAIGGWNGAFLSTNEVFNPATNTWSSLAPMPTPREGLAGAAAPCPGGTIAAGCVFVFGGDNNSGILNTVEVYRTWDNTWLTLPAMPTARTELAGASARCLSGSGTCLYAIDGDTLGAGVLNTNESLKP
jgi:hypothetical protein